MRTYAVYLWPRGALASEIGSDTLFGAVCWAIRILHVGDVEGLLAGFDPPRFAFSSTFLAYRAQGQIIRFYPRPAWLTLTPAEMDRLAAAESRQRVGSDPKTARVGLVDRAKSLGKAVLVSEELFSLTASGAMDGSKLMSLAVAQGKQPPEIERADAALITRAERMRVKPHGTLRNLVRRTAVQHNQIDRLAGATVEGLLFYVSATYFADGAGLWCLVRASDEDMERLIRPALRYLADTGLGADRTAGRGQFDIELADPPPLPDAGPESNGWLTLSRYLPQPDEWQPTGRPLAYRLTNLWAKREQGYPREVTTRRSPVYKRRLRVFEPGSVFPLGVRKEIYGRLAPVGESGWTIYQSGLAIGVPVRVPIEGG